MENDTVLSLKTYCDAARGNRAKLAKAAGVTLGAITQMYQSSSRQLFVVLGPDLEPKRIREIREISA